MSSLTRYRIAALLIAGVALWLQVASKGTTIGVLTFRYFWELGATSSFQGQALFTAFTFAKLWLP